MCQLYAIRSRFQPFTKFHYDAISELILRKREEFEHGAVVLVAVIRDYETLMRLNSPKIGIEIRETDFRHLPLFNPLGLTDIIRDIKGGISVYLESRTTDKEFLAKVMSEQLVIVPIYVKFADLAEILFKREAVAPGITEVFPKVDNVDQKQFLLMMNHTVYDVLGSEHIGEQAAIWFMPLLDDEDCRDAKRIRKLGKERILLGRYGKAPSLNIPGLVTSLGVYGVFACYALGKLHESLGIPMFDDFSPIEDMISTWVLPSTLARYKARVAERVRLITNDFDRNLRLDEKNQYTNETKIIMNFRGLMIAASETACDDAGKLTGHEDLAPIFIGTALKWREINNQDLVTLNRRKQQQFEPWKKLTGRRYDGVRPIVVAYCNLIDALQRANPRSISEEYWSLWSQLISIESPEGLESSGVTDSMIRDFETSLTSKTV